MERPRPLSLCSLSILALVAVMAGAQSEDLCDSTSGPKELPSGEQPAVLLFTDMNTLPAPRSCGDFTWSELAGCFQQFNLKEGCCDPLCKFIIDGLPRDCVKDIGALFCDSQHEFDIFARALLRTTNRCTTGKKKLICKNMAKSSDDKEQNKKKKKKKEGRKTKNEGPISSPDVPVPDLPATPIQGLETRADLPATPLYGLEGGADPSAVNVYGPERGADISAVNVYGPERGADPPAVNVYGPERGADPPAVDCDEAPSGAERLLCLIDHSA